MSGAWAPPIGPQRRRLAMRLLLYQRPRRFWRVGVVVVILIIGNREAQPAVDWGALHVPLVDDPAQHIELGLGERRAVGLGDRAEQVAALDALRSGCGPNCQNGWTARSRSIMPVRRSGRLIWRRR